MKTLYKPPVHPTDFRLEDSLTAGEILHKKAITKKTYQELINIKTERKNRDMEQKPLFFVIGLCISLLLLIIVFNWKTYRDAPVVDLGEVSGDFDEIMEVPPSAQLPVPPPARVEQFVLKEVSDVEIIEDVDIELDVELTEEMSVQEVIFDEPAIEEVEEKAEEIFQIVEDAPAYPGGVSAFYRYVSENIHYPEQALRIGVSGKVFVKFVVEKDGRPSQVEVLKGIGAGCDEEAVRVIQNSPKWIPGKQRGRPVRVYMTLPIHFVFREQ